MASIDYSDERFTNLETEKNTKTTELTNTYDQMINNSDSYYQSLIDATKEYETTQTQLQNEQTELAIDEINQNKEQTEKDYVKEQKAAYTDYQKATNQYGVDAENLASTGMNTTGYSESTRTNAYNTYQNRYATARESYNQAIQSYDNSIAEARLANSSALAEIAYNSLQEQLELSLEGFQYKNELITTKLNALQDLDDTYYSRYQDVVSQINTENALEEQIREYNESLAWEKEQAAQEQSNWEKEYALSLASLNKSSSSSSSSSSGSSGSSSSGSSTINLTSNSSSSTISGENGFKARASLVSQHGSISTTGDNIEVNGNNVAIYEAADGTKWYYNSSKVAYIQIS